MRSGAWVEIDESGSPLDPAAGTGWDWVFDLATRREDVRAALSAGAGSFLAGQGEGPARTYWRFEVTPRGPTTRIIATEPPVGWLDEDIPRVLTRLQAAEGVGHLLFDLDGYIAWVDEGAAQIVGVAEGDLLGRPFALEIVHPDARGAMLEDLRLAARGEEVACAVPVRLPDGALRHVELFIAPTHAPDGPTIALVASIRDVTVAREVARLQNLDAAMFTVSRVMADAAHGVNNLAARMLALCERAARDDDPASFGSALTNMQTLAVTLGDLGQEMLWVSTPGAASGPSNLGKLGHELGRFMRRVAGPEGPPVDVHAAEGLFVKSAPDVFIRAAAPFALRAIDLSRAARSPVHIDAVHSNGAGMLRLRYQAPPGELTLIEHVLQYAAGTPLSILHGEKEGITFRGVPATGGGLAIEITAPLAVMQAPVASVSLSGRTAPRGRLLIADDEVDLRDLYAEILSPSFSEVVKVGDGQAAWEWLEAMNGEFALVLLDLRMPRMDGMDVLRRARERWPALRVIVVSGAAPDGVVQSAMAQGARHVLSKPFTIRELRAVVRVALAEQPQA